MDTRTNRAVRITPTQASRSSAFRYAPRAPDRWHAQLAAYQVMPTEELLTVQGVILNVSLSAIISRHGHRVVCEECGEDVINEREVKAEGQIQCRACAGGAYYEADEPCPLFEHTLTTEIFSMKAA